ncbi:MAG: hypothetical protein ACYC5N_11935, partial [Endomicrobiales bacterium]
MNFRKAVSLITTGCFLFSFVLGEALHASVDNARDAKRFREIAGEFVLPASTARITDGSDCGSRAVVVNIQDLHCHPEVQRNISRILSLLDRKYRLKKIYVEGAAGAVDTSWLGDIKDGKLKKELVEG